MKALAPASFRNRGEREPRSDMERGGRTIYSVTSMISTDRSYGRSGALLPIENHG